MLQSIQVGKYRIGRDCRPFIIAEMSGNHNQSLERALKIVDAAAEAGAHGLKIQTYTADTMTIDAADAAFRIVDSSSLWNGSSLYQLYQQAYTPWDWHQAIFDRCRKHGMIGFSTPFDASAVDFLETHNAPLYKIASFENTDLELIRKVAKTGKPVIISTGMATVGELEEAVRTAREAGCRDLMLLKCTSTYPANPAASNITTIPHMSELFGVQVGLSDHTMGVGAAVASVALGATVIEKHFTLARADGGVDSTFSMEPDEMKLLVSETEKAWQALGTVSYGPTEKEKASMQFRRSLYIVQDLKAGDVLSRENVRAIRPGFGLPVKFMDMVLGKHVNREIKRGTPLEWSIVG